MTARILALCAVALLLAACNTDPTGGHPPSQRELLSRTPLPDQRAEEAAVVLSRQMVAPADLYARISHDLQLIELKHAREYPIKGIPYFLPWYTGRLILKVSPEFLADTAYPGHRVLDSLNELYNVGLGHAFDRWYDIGGVGRYNAVRLVEQYSIVPGIESMGSMSIPMMDGIPADPFFWVLPGDRDYRYFFSYDVETRVPYSVTSHILYFTVIGQRVILRGDWSWTDPTGFSSLPNWFDTLRMAQGAGYYSADWSLSGGFVCIPAGACDPR